jgi:hypothetical protein
MAIEPAGTVTQSATTRAIRIRFPFKIDLRPSWGSAMQQNIVIHAVCDS